MSWLKDGRWQSLLADNQAVLSSIHQMLDSCSALLDNSQVPVEGIVKLLQHILR